jgi:hypothetical protein
VQSLARELGLLCAVTWIIGISAQGQNHSVPHNAEANSDATKLLRHYLDLRLQDADWKGYSQFITWPDEPSWDCKWVTRSYRTQTSSGNDDSITISVAHHRLGIICGLEFTARPKTVTINYQLVKKVNGWKVAAPDIDYPDIGVDTVLRNLKASARNPASTPDERKQARAAEKMLVQGIQSGQRKFHE